MKCKHPLHIIGMALLLFAAGFNAEAQSLNEFEEKVTEFTLDNGLKFIVIERPIAPVASFVTYVDVGGADEPMGHTGIAHIFEHMAFKGTHYIGTNNWDKEKQALDELDKTYQQWLAEKYSPEPDTARISDLWSEFQNLQEEAGQYVVNNEFSQIIERNGGTGLNAGTG
ncbi:MAG TPA: insulinase family protein, partial [Halalkalibaculum sp.]|nr:insulinase family protein [Halalkalibaculum sp.]